MIETKVGNVVEAKEALGRLVLLKLPAKTAYHVSKLARLTGQEIHDYETARVTLVKEMGTTADDGSISVPQDKMPEFMPKLNELLDVATKIDWNPLTIDMLGTAEISAADVVALGPFLTDGQPEEKGAQ